MRLKFIMFVSFLLIMLSCTRYKDIVLLQDTNSKADSANYYPFQVPIYKIQNRDILYIRILSMNREVTELINTAPLSTVNMYTNDASFYIYGYNVSDSGNVEIPIIGKVNVVGKTLEEAKTAITAQTYKLLKDPVVIVKLISFKVSVIGEVTRPGSYQNYNNQFTVLEAISQAGDISPFGNRRKIMIIRASGNGTKTIRLDLTSTNILKSEGYYLLPNDIVYIEPVKSKNFRNNIPAFSLALGAITSFVLVLNYFSPKSSK